MSQSSLDAKKATVASFHWFLQHTGNGALKQKTSKPVMMVSFLVMTSPCDAFHCFTTQIEALWPVTAAYRIVMLQFSVLIRPQMCVAFNLQGWKIFAASKASHNFQSSAILVTFELCARIRKAKSEALLPKF